MVLDFVFGLFGLGPKKDRTIEVSPSASGEAIPIVYGERSVAPRTVFEKVSRNPAAISGGSQDLLFAPATQNLGEDEVRKNLDWLHKVAVLSIGPIEGIRRYRINGDPITATTAHDRFKRAPFVRLATYFGSDPQTAMTALTAVDGRWTSAHRGDGLAYVGARFYNRKKKPQFTGNPDLKAVVRGLRVYDPRKDTTAGGSGSHRFDDPTTWEFAQNRALVLLHYLTSDYGPGYSIDQIDLESFRIEANYCGEDVAIPARLTNTTGATIGDYYDQETGDLVDVAVGAVFPDYRPQQVATTQARHMCDAVIDTGQNVTDNVKTLLEEMGWSLPWSNGKLKLRIDKPVQAAVDTFTEDDILELGTVTRGNRQKRLNRVTITFPNANKRFEEDSVAWPRLDDAQFAAYLAEDNGETLETEIEARTITDYYRALSWAEYTVKRSRADLRVEGLKLPPRAIALEPGDVIQVDVPGRDLGGTWLVVEKVKVSQWLDVSVDAFEYEGSIFPGDHVDNEPLSTVDDAGALWDTLPDVTGLSASQYHELKSDGTTISGIDVDWTDVEGVPGIRDFVVGYRKTDGGSWQYISVPGEANQAQIRGLLDGEEYSVQVFYRTTLGQEADAVFQTVTLDQASTVLNISSESRDYSIEEVLVFQDELLDNLFAVGATWTEAPAGGGYLLTGTGGTVTLRIPSDFVVDGSVADQVHLIMKRETGSDWEFEEIDFRWANSGHGVSNANRVRNAARVASAGFSLMAFDLTQPLTGGVDDWVDAADNHNLQFTFDTTSLNETYLVKAVILGRVKINPNGRGAGSLIPGEIATILGPDSDANNRTLAVIKLGQFGITAGTSIEYSAAIRAYSTRGARLLIRYRDAANTILQDDASNFVEGQPSREVATVLSQVPSGADRAAILVDAEDTGTGLIEAREPTARVLTDFDKGITGPGKPQANATSNLRVVPYDSDSTAYELGDQVSDAGSQYIYVSETGGQSNALTDTAVWRRNADLAANADGVLQGHGTPNNADGSNGDYYYDLSSNLLYIKVAGVWQLWTPVRRNVGALAAADSATTDLIAFRAVTEQSATTLPNFTMGSATAVQTVQASIPIAAEFAGEPVLARVSCITLVNSASGGPESTVSLTVGSETIDLTLDNGNVGDTRQFSITRYFTPGGGTFTVTGSADQAGGSVNFQAFTAEAVLFKR